MICGGQQYPFAASYLPQIPKEEEDPPDVLLSLIGVSVVFSVV